MMSEEQTDRNPEPAIPLSFDPWTAWSRVEPVDWRTAIWSMADLAYLESASYQQWHHRIEEHLQHLIPLDHAHTFALEALFSEIMSEALGFAAVFGFSLARTYPTQVEELATWMGRAHYYGRLDRPLRSRAQSERLGEQLDAGIDATLEELGAEEGEASA
jgi:hypothetical protein